ncbi:MAG TPA: TonB-dependent receptor plug domain-containing protein [Kofleriaceae bacterium]|nr:TonB-dependent receptor plug domain-containing protein [Kofleriaceae bacterium]
MIRPLLSIGILMLTLVALPRVARSQPVDAGVADAPPPDAAPPPPPPPPPQPIGHTEEPPQVKQAQPPLYPDLPAGKPKPIVDVDVHVEVDASGVPYDPHVLSPPNPPFDDLATTSVLSWTFEPAKRDGVAVQGHVDVKVHFDPNATAGEVITMHGTVREATKELSRGASTIDITPSRLSKTAQASAGKILEQAPGLFLANEGGGGHADQVFLRGFDAEQGQDIEFTVEGVPINEVDNTDGHGYADTHFIIPEVVKNLHVIEGPFDPHQGDFAVAGSAAYELGVLDRGLTFEYGYGQYDTQRTLAIWAPQTERDATFGAVQIFSSAGYGINRADNAASAMSQYEGTFGEHGLWRVLATAYATHYKSAGVVRADDVASGKISYYGTEDPSQGGDAQRYTLSFSLEDPVEAGVAKQQVFLTFRTLRIVEDFTGFLLDNPEPGQSFHPQRGDAIEQDYDAITAGARGSYKLTGKAFDQDQSLELGYYARYDHTDPAIQRLRFGTDIPYLIDTTLTTDIVDLAAYADLDLHPTSWLTLRGGARQEFFSYDILNNCATDGAYQRNEPLNVLCPAYDSAGERQPTARIAATGVITEPKVTALANVPGHVQLTASAGIGAQSLDAAYISQDENAPFSELKAYEGGAIYHDSFTTEGATRPDLDLTARAVGYYTHVDRDLIFDPLQGRLSASTGTTRRGFVLAAHAASPWLNELASFTYAYATYDADHTLVPYVPSTVARSDTSVVHALPDMFEIDDRPLIGSAGLGLNFVGPRALPLGQVSQSTFTMDASASVRWRYLRLGAQVWNVLNARYPLTEYFYASDFHNGPPYATLAPTLNFTAAPPRTVMFTLAFLFDQEARR